MERVGKSMSFWEHLDVLRAVVVRAAVVTVVCGMAAFCFKGVLFDVVLAPKDDGFVTYRLLRAIAEWAGGELMPFEVRLINTGLAQQLMVHVKTALCAGVVCASPYVLYEVFGFVSPALHEGERRYATRVVAGGYAMFVTGVAVCYFLVFPLTFRFLGTYQVSGEVENMITLESYISTLTLMCLTMGVVFEIPVVAWMFARMGLLSAGMMRRYRRHAVVVIVAAAAVITPTADVPTLALVALPMYGLYEVSVGIVGRVSAGKGG